MFTSGVCGQNRSYFDNLVRRFVRERVSLALLAQDLGCKPLIVEKKVDLERLKTKFRVRG